MALKHSFEKKGNQLFKFRGQIPVVLFLAAIPAIYLSDLQTIKESNWLGIVLLIAGICVSLIGQIIRSIAIGMSSKQTSGRNIWGQEAKALNTTGIYSTVRHPLYLGNFFLWMGIVISTGNYWFVLIVCLLFWLYYERIMFAEEAFLEREFDEEYLEWSAKTPVFIPSMRNYKKTSVHFSMKTILRREYPGVSATIIGFVYVDFVREWIVNGEPIWLWSHGIGIFIALMISLILRTLKHSTDVLREDDRS
ncbi:MAG: protein-S-isoprenylcysteine O-methyltransferase Ste14 [Crocinitomicaceae bacterium]|jgi:protein-S-isoprenylcysteine O-methyltransferase Ste14